MRMRRKKWARPELSECPFYIDKPEELKGQWKEQFKNKSNPIYMELGCGKGGFLEQHAIANPEINFIGIDLISDMLGVARRKIQKAYDDNHRTPDNILLTSLDISMINRDFSNMDVIDKIYINFCNPWYKPKHYKKRLTHPRQLIQYCEFLKDGGEIWFKTDSEELFNSSLDYFKQTNFEVTFITYDLHNSEVTESFMTEHEKMYSEEGIRIKFLIAKKLKTL